jgi:hypothetical protein
MTLLLHILLPLLPRRLLLSMWQCPLKQQQNLPPLPSRYSLHQ